MTSSWRRCGRSLHVTDRLSGVRCRRRGLACNWLPASGGPLAFPKRGASPRNSAHPLPCHLACALAPTHARAHKPSLLPCRRRRTSTSSTAPSWSPGTALRWWPSPTAATSAPRSTATACAPGGEARPACPACPGRRARRACAARLAGQANEVRPAHRRRPGRYYVTKTGRVIMGSEVGVVDIPPQVCVNARPRARRCPGRRLPASPGCYSGACLLLPASRPPASVPWSCGRQRA